MKDFDRFMMDQDTGGAIRAAGRADIYMGVGAAAEILAGNQFADGTFYYFVLKPEFVSKYPVPGKAAAPAVAAKPAAPAAPAATAGTESVNLESVQSAGEATGRRRAPK
jgi:hypothetical protein